MVVVMAASKILGALRIVKVLHMCSTAMQMRIAPVLPYFPPFFSSFVFVFSLPLSRPSLEQQPRKKKLMVACMRERDACGAGSVWQSGNPFSANQTQRCRYDPWLEEPVQGLLPLSSSLSLSLSALPPFVPLSLLGGGHLHMHLPFGVARVCVSPLCNTPSCCACAHIQLVSLAGFSLSFSFCFFGEGSEGLVLRRD